MDTIFRRILAPTSLALLLCEVACGGPSSFDPPVEACNQNTILLALGCGEGVSSGERVVVAVVRQDGMQKVFEAALQCEKSTRVEIAVTGYASNANFGLKVSSLSGVPLFEGEIALQEKCTFWPVTLLAPSPMSDGGGSPDLDVTMSALPEECNGIDDDGNGVMDDISIPPACELSSGVCVGAKKKCGGVKGWLSCSSEEYTKQYELTEASCDGLDNDCNGKTDEAFPLVSSACQVGTGECKSAGKHVCNSSKNAVACDAAPKSPTTEICNGKDDDCNGANDNGFECVLGVKNSACVQCGATGTRSCSSACTWETCTGFSFKAIHWEDVWSPFTHDCGRNCQGDICATESDTPGECKLISGGTKTLLPPGKYELLFWVGDAGVFDFQVVAGGKVIASSSWVDTGKITRSDVIVPFTVAVCTDAEPTIVAKPMARMRLAWIDLKRVGDI